MEKLDTFINAVSLITNKYNSIVCVFPEMFFILACMLFTVYSAYYSQNVYLNLFVYLVCEFILLCLFCDYIDLGEFIFIRTLEEYFVTIVVIGFCCLSYVFIKTTDFEYKLLLFILMFFIFVFFLY